MIRPAATVRTAGPTSPVRAAARIMGQAKYTGAQPAPSAWTICWSRTNTGARLDGDWASSRTMAALRSASASAVRRPARRARRGSAARSARLYWEGRWPGSSSRARR